MTNVRHLKVDKSRQVKQPTLASCEALFENRLLISCEEAARLLGISLNALYLKVNRNKITFRRLDRRVMFSKEDIMALLSPHGATNVSR